MFRVQTRYQDEGWENYQSEFMTMTLAMAVATAERISRDGIAGGMARVIDLAQNRVIVEFPAGHQPMDYTIFGNQVDVHDAPIINQERPLHIAAVEAFTPRSATVPPAAPLIVPDPEPRLERPNHGGRALRHIRLRD